MSAAPLRILQVAAPARSGGLETVLAQLATSLRGRGHDVQVALVLTPGSERGHPLVELLEASQVPTKVLLLGSRQYAAERRAVAQHAAAMRADIVHTHGYRADILHGAPSRKAGRAQVMTLHGFVSGNWRDRLYEWLQLRAAARADAVVAVSAPIVGRLDRAGVPRSTVHLLRNAVAPAAAPLARHAARAALGLAKDAKLVGWVGRLSYEKGPDLFLDALQRTAPDIHGVFLGEGPMSESLQQRVQQGELAGRVHFCGVVPGASRYLAAFDALALSSRTEGTPMILLEAMASQVPIVTALVGGVPDVLSTQEAWCCEAGNVSAMAAAIEQLLRSPDDALTRAERAAERVEREFSLTTWLDRHEEIYRQAIARRQ